MSYLVAKNNQKYLIDLYKNYDIQEVKHIFLHNIWHITIIT